MADTNQIKRILLNFPGVLTIFQAAIEDITTSPAILKKVIINELKNADEKSRISHTFVKLENKISLGNAAASTKISEKLFTEFTITK
jgi:hypothetical protein